MGESFSAYKKPKSIENSGLFDISPYANFTDSGLYHQWKEELLTKEEYIAQKDEFTLQEAECQRKLELLNQYLAESLSIQNIAGQKSGLVVLAETQGLTEELVDGLIERIEVYSDERVEMKWKVRDVIE